MDLNVPGPLIVEMFERRVVGNGLVSHEIGSQRPGRRLVARIGYEVANPK